MLRKLALALALVVMMLPGWVSALGIGDIELHSFLNQPLNAEIELLGATQQDLENIRVTLAARDEFSRAGLEFFDSLRQLTFSTVRNKNGKNYIKVITKDDFREPFLNFLLEVNWGKGRILREYTLLVDPPVLSSSKPVVMTAPVTQAPVKQAPATQAPEEGELFPRIPIDSPAQSSQPESVVKSPVVTTAPVKTTSPASVSGQYRTKRNDTAWNIAKRLSPDDGVSINQVMIGLLQENPEAFIGNNINRLKAGYVLSVPDRAAMTSMSKSAARAEVNRQYQVWKSGTTTSTIEKVTKAPVVAEKTEKGRLELLAPKTGDIADSDKLAGAGTEQIQKELALAKEASEAQTQENTELRDRIGQLEEQISNANRLTTLQDAHLAELQSKLAELQAAEKPGVVEAKPEVEGAPISEDAAVGVKPDDISKLDKAIVPEKPLEAPPVVAPVVKAPVADTEAGFVEKTTAYLVENPMMAVIAGSAILILLALIILLFRSRMRAGAGFQESILQERAHVEPQSAPQIPDAEEAIEDRGISEEISTDATSDYLSDFAVSNLDVEPGEVGETDPLTEADVFLAYGRFQPAESMIKEAIEKEPERTDLKLKLMEIFYAAKNRDEFEKEAIAFHESLDHPDPVWDKVVEMGQDLSPDNALFAEGAQSAEELEIPDFGDIDIPEEPAAEKMVAESEGGMLDFDLGNFEETVGSDDNSAAEELVTNVPEMDLDFDVENVTDQVVEESTEIKAEDDADKLAEDMASELENLVSSMDSDAETSEADVDKLEEELVDFDFDAVDSATVHVADSDAMEEGLSELDEVGTKLDLAKAYIDMGDPEGAKNILSEVMEEGNDEQKKEAEELQSQLS